MERSKENDEKHFRALLARDDVALFTNGGCGVFADVLNQIFGYQIRSAEDSETGGLHHIYCQISIDQDYAVDVLGVKPEGTRIYSDFPCATIRSLSSEELHGMFRPAGGGGLLGEKWFVDVAAARARAHIERYRSYYDGTNPTAIPGR